MLRLSCLLLVIAAACSTPSSASEPAAPRHAPVPSGEDPASAPAGEALGAALTQRETVPLADLLANPARYEGQVVRTSGPVRAVCQHRGCWMDIGGAEESEGRVHVRSLDHSLAFPREAVGRIAEVEGELQAMPGASACGEAEADGVPGCGVAAAGRRVQLAVRGVVLR